MNWRGTCCSSFISVRETGRRKGACPSHCHRLEFYLLKANWVHVLLFPRSTSRDRVSASTVHVPAHLCPARPRAALPLCCFHPAVQCHPSGRPYSNAANGLNNQCNVIFPPVKDPVSDQELHLIVMDWIVSPQKKKKICWSSNPQDLRMWLYLEIRSLQR